MIPPIIMVNISTMYFFLFFISLANESVKKKRFQKFLRLQNKF